LAGLAGLSRAGVRRLAAVRGGLGAALPGWRWRRPGRR